MRPVLVFIIALAVLIPSANLDGISRIPSAPGQVLPYHSDDAAGDALASLPNLLTHLTDMACLATTLTKAPSRPEPARPCLPKRSDSCDRNMNDLAPSAAIAVLKARGGSGLYAVACPSARAPALLWNVSGQGLCALWLLFLFRFHVYQLMRYRCIRLFARGSIDVPGRIFLMRTQTLLSGITGRRVFHLPL